MTRRQTQTARPLPAKPLIAAAVFGVSLLAATAGAQMGSSPILPRGIGQGTVSASAAEEVYFSDAPQPSQPLPDHYPLVTPQGTIPVEELAYHGRMRNLRETWWVDREYVPADSDYTPMSDAELDRLARADLSVDYARTQARETIEQAPQPVRPQAAAAAPALALNAGAVEIPAPAPATP